ncbi:MAG TPA: SH3-like domain-containing protein [Solirubrobacteraceae bacterium]|nr:SH3-like domain-containing protein [Solirubrobacteraceae bacterium]
MSYRPGQRVRVDHREHEGHHRTPAYLKGKTGTVERVHPAFRNPETRAYGEDGLPKQPLYLVGFEQRDVWPGYGGHVDDRLYVDVFEHWLQEAE